MTHAKGSFRVALSYYILLSVLDDQSQKFYNILLPFCSNIVVFPAITTGNDCQYSCKNSFLYIKLHQKSEAVQNIDTYLKDI